MQRATMKPMVFRDVPFIKKIEDKKKEYSWDEAVPNTLPNNRYFVGHTFFHRDKQNVWKASHPFFGNVAIKHCVTTHDTYNKHTSILSRIQGHTNMIKIVDSWNVRHPNNKTDHSSYYFAMELLEGTLSDKIKNGMSRDEIYKCTKQLVSALVFLHKKGITHFNITPDHIGYKTIDGHTTYVILDFSSAEWYFTMNTPAFQDYIQTHPKTAPLYCSPEMCGLKGYVTDKIDVWSLGCIIYEMLTKTPLLMSEDRLRIIESKAESSCLTEKCLYQLIISCLSEVSIRPTSSDLCNHFFP